VEERAGDFSFASGKSSRWARIYCPVEPDSNPWHASLFDH
jgi:hypothetical protein